jgi:hypothetical protein
MEKYIYKRCVHCKVVKPASSFNKHSNTKDGLQPWCRACQSEYNKTHQKTQGGEEETARQSNLPVVLGNCVAYMNSDGEVAYSINGEEISRQDIEDLIWIIEQTYLPDGLI